jgi:two-component system sensor histidine kinase BaeS
MIHFYLTKKLLHPLRALIESAKKMKQGEYPDQIKVESRDEIGQLSGHFNDLVQQLKDNEQNRKKLSRISLMNSALLIQFERLFKRIE